MTSAADVVTTKEIDDAVAMRAALLENERQQGKIANRAYERMTKPADTHVNIGQDANGSAG